MTRTNEDLQALNRKRNKVNNMVNIAKADFIKKRLRQNRKNPRKFWKSINGLIKQNNNVDISNIVFRDPANYTIVSEDMKPDYLNDFFVNIAENTRGPDNMIPKEVKNFYDGRDLPGFDFLPPDIFDIKMYLRDIDLEMSSCIDGVNMNVCKLFLDNCTDMW